LGERLTTVRTLLVKVGFDPSQSQRVLFGDLDQFVAPARFHLLQLYELACDADGSLVAGTALYQNERYA
jgi:hypothetical protein